MPHSSEATTILPANLELAALRSQYEAGALNKAAYSREVWPMHERLFEYSRFLADTNVGAIEINADGVIFQLRDPDLKLWCSRRDRGHVAMTNLNFRNYEPEEMRAVLQLARVCNTIFDIGANVGLYSIALGQRFPSSKVMAFEPVPDTYRELCRNLTLNSISNVTTFNVGLSDRCWDAPFFFDPTVSGAASGAPLGSEYPVTESLTCPVETLDSFVERTGVAPDFIKCDVEGGELAVFRGATQLLERSKPIVFTEMLRKWSARFGYHPNDIIALFRDAGYECFFLSAGTLHRFLEMDESTVETNFFFLHSQRHLEVARVLGLMK
ncbi:methyltransferase, FkbM family domain protein [Acidisarcina polymorpha]|uniref:Methyltransferase, FkbM family domain protein n=1 Tax=Acidisarcina polymorpha TaxID=2211140 RepID=A0A2Z5FYM4_9BACT|nr:FkbM family methyltransferase [Acidisarcina polymorpha]AXC11515.1 methyltransferase, FkbM family domain protein [Acidisarcina polymorpha]